MAATIFGWRCPVLLTAMPDAKSIKRRPSMSHNSAFSARSAKKSQVTPTPRGVAASLRALSSALFMESLLLSQRDAARYIWRDYRQVWLVISEPFRRDWGSHFARFPAWLPIRV